MGNECCVRGKEDLANYDTGIERMKDKNEQNLPKEKVSFENTTSNRDTIESGRIELKTKDDNNFNLFHSQINENNYNNNIIEEKEKNIIKEEINDENNDNVSNKGKNYINEGEIDKDNYNINENKKKKHDPPYWNENSNEDLENLLYDLSDEKSDKIFNLFNDIRTNISNYKEEFINQGILNLYNDFEINTSKPNKILKNESYYYNLREHLLNLNSTPMSEEERIEIILNDNVFKNYKDKNIYTVQCEIDNENNAIWNLLIENKNEALNNILTKVLDYCIICAYPIQNSYNMKVYFLLLSN